jgi:hypothetical protein
LPTGKRDDSYNTFGSDGINVGTLRIGYLNSDMPAHTEPSVGPASVENHHSTEISPTANLRVNNTIKTLRVSSLGSTAYEE